MAGKVRVEVSHFNHGVVALTPAVCPVPAAGRSAYPNCVVADLNAPHHNVCPYLMQVRIRRGGSAYDLCGCADHAAWLATLDRVTDSVEVICLRCESEWTEAGARLRP